MPSRQSKYTHLNSLLNSWREKTSINAMPFTHIPAKSSEVFPMDISMFGVKKKNGKKKITEQS